RALESTGDGQRLLEGASRRLDVPGTLAGFAQVGEQFAAEGRVTRGVEIERLERPLVEPSRILVGQPRCRLGRPPPVRAPPPPPPPPRGTAEPPRQPVPPPAPRASVPPRHEARRAARPRGRRTTPPGTARAGTAAARPARCWP